MQPSSLLASVFASVTPAPRLLYCVLAWALLGLGSGAWPPLQQVWAGAGFALLLIACADLWLSRLAPALRIERALASVWPVDVWNTVTLTLHNEGTRVLTLDIYDGYPVAWAMEGLSHSTRIAPGSFAAVSYRLKPDLRGNAGFGPAHLRFLSRLGLWRRISKMGPAATVKVFPDFSKLLGRTLSATDRRSPAAGMIRKRRRGEGTDFRQLREYRPGDSLRSIDWKATARHHRPISREYQEERDQQVVFLLDSGRRMLAQDDGSSHFDHALDAVLTLGFLAQKQGDAVGLMSFGESSRWLPPVKGRVGLDRLLAGVYDLQPTDTAPDYTQAATALLEKLGKRAFVVLITNLRDEDDRALRTACELISTRHLVMCASLREKALDAAVRTPVENFADALRHSATTHYLQQRSEAIRRLGIRADRLIDITPERLSTVLVNRYRDIKESGQL
ncbi:DUF58 domain-containing protein [Undibacterium sp.]|uniref:DUF58 domain-containing protein n=1 Tax=Undibacterium sp. TaxID=1914977 RepID=UPI00374CA5E6